MALDPTQGVEVRVSASNYFEASGAGNICVVATLAKDPYPNGAWATG